MTQSKPYQPITLNFLKQKKVDKMTLEAFPKFFGGIYGIGLSPMNIEHPRIIKAVSKEFIFDDLAEKLLDKEDWTVFEKETARNLAKFKVKKNETYDKMFSSRGYNGKNHDKWLLFTAAHDELFRKYYYEAIALSFCRLYREGMSQ